MKIFFYDDNCHFCNQLSTKLKSLTLNREIQFLSFRNFSEKELKQFHKDLNFDLMQANVQYIYNGKRFPGFFAVRKLSSDLKIYRFFFWVLYLPLIPFIGIFVMNLLKKYKN